MDHQSLKWLHSMKSPNGIYWRWMAKLAMLDYDLGWSQEKKMGCADGLSRSPHMDEPTIEEEEEGDEYIGNTQVGQIDLVEIRSAQEEDEVLREVNRWVQGNPPTKQGLRGHPACYKQ